MWDDRLNEYLDDPSKPPSEDVKDQYVRYRYVMEVYAASLHYNPSEKMREDFLKKIRRRKKFKKTIKYALVFGSVAIAIIGLKLFQTPSGSDFADLNDLANSIQIVRTVGDGF